MAGRKFNESVAASVGAKVFPSLGVSMTEREIQSVIEYVIVVPRGKGEDFNGVSAVLPSGVPSPVPMH